VIPPPAIAPVRDTPGDGFGATVKVSVTGPLTVAPPEIQATVLDTPTAHIEDHSGGLAVAAAFTVRVPPAAGTLSKS
jgi:hypothetical protein